MQSRTKKILVGVGLAIAGVAVVFIGLIIGLIVWIGQPTPLADSVRLLSPETTGYAELSLDGEDTGTAAFLERFQQAGRQPNRGPGGAPEFFASGNLVDALPIVAAWTMTPAPNDADGDLHVGMLSLPLFGKWLTVLDGFIALVGGGDDVAAVRYNDERIYDVNTRGFQGAMFLREGTLFVTSDVFTAQSAVDLISGSGTGDRAVAESPVGRLIEQAPEVPFRGAISNANGELLRLLAKVNGGALPPQITLDEVDGTYFSGTLDETGGLQARATILSTSGDWTDAEMEAVRTALAAVIEDSFPESAVTVNRSGSDLVIVAAIPNLAEGLVDLGNEIGTGQRR